MVPIVASSAIAGSRAVRDPEKAAMPRGSTRTPEPTSDFTRDGTIDVREAPLSSSSAVEPEVPAAALSRGVVGTERSDDTSTAWWFR